MERVEVIVGGQSADVAGDAGRGLRRWEREQDFDRALLGWAARFAFVTAAVLAERWGVSEQRMRARLRRLERSGLVRRQRGGPNEPARVVVTEAGGSLVGLTVRTPRGGEPLGHELAVIKRVIAIERHFEANGQRGARVLSERDMRRDQQASSERWAVEVVRARGRIESGYYALGEYDAILICEMPDNSTAAAIALAVGAGGTVSSYRTTVLLTSDEAVQAMRTAGESIYKLAPA